MQQTGAEKGVLRPLWLAVAVVTCVIFGSTVNRCLTCGIPADRGSAEEPKVGGGFFGAETPAPAEPAQDAIEPFEKPGPRESRTLKKLLPAEEGAYVSVTFDRLASWIYTYPEPEAKEGRDGLFPVSIQKLDGRGVAIKGFMIPITVDGEDVTEFLLVRSRMFCCFGVMPKMNEWLHIKMAKGKKSPYAVDIPITVFGKMAVGEIIENGVVMSLYRMEGEEVSEPVIFR
ncbi:MAG: DUF3299 domain-containing protein [Planctomycetota bacterium]|jgi:hypothetical protein